MMFDDRPKKKKPSTIPALAAAIVAVLAISVLLWPAQIRESVAIADRDEALGVALGSALALSGIVWLVAYFGFVRRARPERGAIYFVILFALALPAELTAYAAANRIRAHDRAQDAAAANGLLSAIDKALKVDSGHAPTVDITPRASGDAGQLERAEKQYFNDVLADQNAYRDELAALDLKSVMNPVSLGRDPGVRLAKSRLAQARQVVAKYRARNLARLDEFRGRIDHLPVNANTKRAALASIDSHYAENRAALVQVWTFETTAIDEYSEAVNVLARSQGRWDVDGGHLRFVRPTEMRAYNAHIEAARTAVAEEKAMQEQRRDDFEHSMRQAIAADAGPP
jgi:hypothetical protein